MPSGLDHPMPPERRRPDRFGAVPGPGPGHGRGLRSRDSPVNAPATEIRLETIDHEGDPTVPRQNAIAPSQIQHQSAGRILADHRGRPLTRRRDAMQGLRITPGFVGRFDGPTPTIRCDQDRASLGEGHLASHAPRDRGGAGRMDPTLPTLLREDEDRSIGVSRCRVAGARRCVRTMPTPSEIGGPMGKVDV